MSSRDPSEHDAVINLASLLRDVMGAGGEVEAEGSFVPLSKWHSDEVHFIDPLSYRLTVRAAGGDDFMVNGEVAGKVTMACRRCLEPVEVESESEFFYELRYRPGTEQLEMRYGHEGDGDEDEVLVFGKPEVDFAQMMTEIFSVDLPLVVEHPAGAECEPLLERYAQRTEKKASPFSSLEGFDVDKKE